MLKRDDKLLCLPSHGENRGSSPLGSARKIKHLVLFCSGRGPGVRNLCGTGAVEEYAQAESEGAREWLARHPRCLSLLHRRCGSRASLPNSFGTAWGVPVCILVASLRTCRKSEEFGVGGLCPSVELPAPRRGRAVCDVSHVWHAPRACYRHPHERPRHTRIPPLIGRVILGLSVDVLGPRWIMLKRWDRPNARSASAEAIDHRPPILADGAGAHLIPSPHRSALWHARIVGSVEWTQARLDQHLVHSLCDRRAAVLLEARGVEHPVAECSVASLSLDYALGYGLGGHLEPHIAARSAVPLPVPHERATREQSIWAAFGAAHVVVVGDDRPPTH